MNKLLMSVLLLLLLLTGCMRNTPNKNMTPSSIPSTNPVFPRTAPVEPAVPYTTPAEPVVPQIQGGVTPVNAEASDTIMYRGTVTEISDKKGKQLLTLEQAAGTNFGAAILGVIVNDSTRMITDKSEIKTGSYVEVFFDKQSNDDMTQAVTAISLEKLPDAKSSVFNGTLEKLSQNRKEKDSGSLTMKSLDGEQKIVFNYGPESNICLDMKDLKKGVKLNIFFSGATSASEPPQAYALEIRYFAG